MRFWDYVILSESGITDVLMDTKVCLVAWKYASLAIQFAVRRIETFNGICGVNYHSDFICNLQSLVLTPYEVNSRLRE